MRERLWIRGDSTLMGRVVKVTRRVGNSWLAVIEVGGQMASNERNIVELNLTGAETATATVMQMADALQADTVKLAESSRQMRAMAHELALMLNEARQRRVLQQNSLHDQAKQKRAIEGELDAGTPERAEALLRALQGVEDDTLGALQSWLDDPVASTPARRFGSDRFSSGVLPDTMRRSISVSGFAFAPNHGDDPKTDGEAARMRIKVNPGAPPLWLNLATVVLLARIGARTVLAVADTDEDDEDEYEDWDDYSR